MRRMILGLALAATLALPGAAAGAVVGAGYNAGWQLGAGFHNGFDTTAVATLGLPDAIQEVAPGDGGSLVLGADGTAYFFGGDGHGQCGCGVRVSVITHPVAVKLPPGAVVSRVAMAGGHGMVLTSTGQVYAFGGNLFGTDGNGTTTHGKEIPGAATPTPVLVALPGPARDIVAGGGADYAVMPDDSVMAWGENSTGQLGDGTTVEQTRPVRSRVSEVRQLSAGGIGSHGGHAVAILNSGSVVAWGADGQGQLGDGTTKTSPLPVPVKITGTVASTTSAVSHSLAVMDDGTLRAWGSNVHGELGTPTTQKCARAMLSCSSTPVPVVGLSSVTQASANFGYSVAASAGRGYGFGWNQYGQLGNGTRTDSPLPTLVSGLSGVLSIKAGVHHMLAVLAGEGPPPSIVLTDGPGRLAVAWLSSSTTERWTVAVRPIAKPAKPWEYVKPTLPASTRSYTATSLQAGVAYQVLVKNAGFGSRIVQGVPQ